MPPTKTAPYGSWKSPITSDLIVAQITMLSEVRLAGGDIYWLEGRPAASELRRNVFADPNLAHQVQLGNSAVSMLLGSGRFRGI